MTGRGLRGRRLARLMFLVAIAPAVLIGAVFMFPPSMIGPMFEEPPESITLGTIVVGAGIVAYVVGLVQMIRIYRADPEAGRSYWRFRNH